MRLRAIFVCSKQSQAGRSALQFSYVIVVERYLVFVAVGATMEPSLPTELDQQNIEPSPASQTAGARFCLFGASALLIAGLASVSFAGIKKVPYPEIKVTIDAAYHPDAAFEKMQAAFVDAVAKKDVPALSALVAPTFLWTIGGRPSDELDLGTRTALSATDPIGTRSPR